MPRIEERMPPIVAIGESGGTELAVENAKGVHVQLFVVALYCKSSFGGQVVLHEGGKAGQRQVLVIGLKMT